MLESARFCNTGGRSTGAGELYECERPIGQHCGRYEGMKVYTCVVGDDHSRGCVRSRLRSTKCRLGHIRYHHRFLHWGRWLPNLEWVYAASLSAAGVKVIPGEPPLTRKHSRTPVPISTNTLRQSYRQPDLQTDITSPVTVTFGSSPWTNHNRVADRDRDFVGDRYRNRDFNVIDNSHADSDGECYATASYPTGTSSATSTATPTATSTATLTPTATATMTASATSSATPTSTPTMTPSPTGTATPNCNLNFDLTTNPSGTLAFGDVSANVPVTLPLTVTNQASLPFPVGTLSLSRKIRI